MTSPPEISNILRGPTTNRSWEPYVRCLPAALYLVLVHLVSSVQGEDLPALIDDRVAHFIEYFILGVLLHVAFSGFDRKGRPWVVFAGVVLFAAVYGSVDEFHQSFVPGRDPSLKDIAFDVAGATSAALLTRWLAWRRLVR